MSEELPTNSRVYTPGQVCVSCLIGGPAAATWLIAENFRVFNDRHKRITTFLCGAITLLVLMAIGLMLPRHTSGTVLAAVVAGGSREITKSQQGSRIEEWRAKGGRIASWWAAVGVGFIGIIATVGLFVFLIRVIS